MTTLTIPSFERRLLQTVKEELTAQSARAWPQQSLELCLGLLRAMRAHTADMRPALTALLAEGVEARSFARDYGPLLANVDEFIAGTRELVDQVSAARDAASESLAVELASLEHEA